MPASKTGLVAPPNATEMYSRSARLTFGPVTSRSAESARSITLRAIRSSSFWPTESRSWPSVEEMSMSMSVEDTFFSLVTLSPRGGRRSTAVIGVTNPTCPSHRRVRLSAYITAVLGWHHRRNDSADCVRFADSSTSSDWTPAVVSPDWTSSLLVPRASPPRKRLVPKKSELGLLSRDKDTDKGKDLSDVVRRVSGNSLAKLRGA
ncbi:hypothetical protein C8J56DRAFT_122694 [Mycena floridula]|nr:hypothetical protein C8J56DRAFT_122694 [Mycena floridula]